jgi:hypothetical protein
MCGAGGAASGEAKRGGQLCSAVARRGKRERRGGQGGMARAEEGPSLAAPVEVASGGVVVAGRSASSSARRRAARAREMREGEGKK